MSKHLNYWKGRNKKGYQKVIGIKEKLHANSKELLSVLIKHDVLKSGMKVFELGCGCGRNLYYIFEFMHDSGQQITIAGNDLDRASCYDSMDDLVKANLQFYQIDTQQFVVTEKDLLIDLFISSDHLMHLEGVVVDNVLLAINDIWKPMFVLLRETTKGRDRLPVKYAHDYSKLEDRYEKVCYIRSKQDLDYFICLYKKSV